MEKKTDKSPENGVEKNLPVEQSREVTMAVAEFEDKVKSVGGDAVKDASVMLEGVNLQDNSEAQQAVDELKSGIDLAAKDAAKSVQSEASDAFINEIQGVTKLAELLNVIEKSEGIKEENQFFSPKMIKDVVLKYFRGEIPETEIPSSMRDVVKKLKDERDQRQLKEDPSAKIIDIRTRGDITLEKGIEGAISQATSFDEVLSLIDKHKLTIQGSQEIYSPEMLKNVVTKIRSREWTVDKATGGLGFRDKLKQLLDTDSDLAFLKRTLLDVEQKLGSGSYYSGESASSSMRLNKRRDERIEWKYRLKDAIGNAIGKMKN